MELAEAKELLDSCDRSELRDHAFGDVEVFWSKDHEEIGGGFFGGGNASVWISGKDTAFDNDEARSLRECGKLVAVERNDETGPENFTEGDIQPGLSKGDVFHELTGQYLDER